MALLATGGTIATRSAPGGRAVALDAAALLAAADVPPGVDVAAVDVAGRASFAASLDDLAALAATVRRAADTHDGVVVTHGTDTLEEAAALLALTAAPGATVVLTGAQRPADDPDPDGPGNLTAALAHAAHGPPGVTVAFAGRLWPALGVRKIHTEALDAFAVPGASEGPSSAPGTREGPSPTPEVPPTLPRVDVIAHYVGVDAHALHAAVAAGARGIVLAAFGVGNTTPALRDAALELLARGVPVAVASRTGAGPVAGLYAGGGADLAAAGALFAGDLSPWQARILLSLALAVHPDDPLRAARDWCGRAGVTATGDAVRS